MQYLLTCNRLLIRFLKGDEMKSLLLMVFFSFVLAGCAAGTNFQPKTAEGANCKADCAKGMVNCRASSYSCDRASATCMSACEDLDRIKSK